nr:MAG TPA: hypothetical protein [Caudoviricetes sp.]
MLYSSIEHISQQPSFKNKTILTLPQFFTNISFTFIGINFLSLSTI